ncbi:hypothetical protein [Streptomyces sp. NPDC050704]|uniref:hypothetical protein n=1 Tax=Streptomyces sp. NPDC050704 TaxID=3157219 RepID=UPI00341CF720
MAEYEGLDALLAAITDEPLPEGARDDAEFMAEHRSAVSDVALLREQLVAIGNTLADPERTESTEGVASTEQAEHAEQAEGAGSTGGLGSANSAGGAGSAAKPAAVRAPQLRARPRPRPRRRPFAVAFGTLAAAAAAALVIGGMGWLISQAGTGDSDSGASADSGSGQLESDSGDSSLSEPGSYVACARLVFEGTVESVEPVPGADQDRISMTVDRYYKPAKGEDEVTFLMDVAVDPRLRKGDHALIGIPRNGASPDLWAVGEKEITKERAWITKALSESRPLTC